MRPGIWSCDLRADDELNKNKMQLQDAQHTNNKNTHKDIATDIGLLGWFSEKRRDADSPKIVQKTWRNQKKSN